MIDEMINKIYNEDCLIGMSDIPDKSIDMILCDLPYGTTDCVWDTIIPLEPLWEHYKRVIKDNGAIVLTASQPFTTILIGSNMKDFKYNWIWKKLVGAGFLNAKKQPLRDTEDVCVFYKKHPTYNPQMKKSNVKIRKTPSKAKKKNHDDSVYGSDIIGKTAWTDKGFRYPTQTIENKYDKSRFDSSKDSQENRHPTKKPVSLMEYLIKTYTNENETVLDNCIGSGTTAIACINTKRNYIGYEMDKTYFDLASARIDKHTKEFNCEVGLFAPPQETKLF